MQVENITHSPDGKMRITLVSSFFGSSEINVEMLNRVKDKIIEAIAIDFIEKHSSDILGKFDQQAIANMTMAQISKMVASKQVVDKE